MAISSAPRLIRVDFRQPFADFDVDPFTQQVIQDRIGRELRDMYADLMQQPLPDHLRALLSRLSEADRSDAHASPSPGERE